MMMPAVGTRGEPVGSRATGRFAVNAWAVADREERLARQRDDYRAMSAWDRCICEFHAPRLPPVT